MSETHSHLSTQHITFTYGAAAASLVASVVTSTFVLAQLFGLWVGSFGVMSPLLGYTGLVTASVSTALFSVIAFMLYRKVTKLVGAQQDYVHSGAYNFITNSLVAIFGAITVIMVSDLAGVLLSSLLLIGTSTNIGALYLNQFLPDVVAAGLVVVVGLCAFKIMKGKNLSFTMTLTTMIFAGVLLLATLVTVPLEAHLNNSSKSSDINQQFMNELRGYSN